MNRQERQEIEARVLDMKHNDTFTARFYLHKVKHVETPETLAAMEKAKEAVRGRTDANGIPKDPDFSPKNLLRLGAREEVITRPYVELKRVGSKDSKSYPVDNEHINRFPDEWEKFQEQERAYFQKQQQVLQDGNDRPDNQSPSGNYGGGVCYTPTPYTTTFG